jgi:integrase
LTVAAYLGQWLEAKQPALRPESFRRYREMCHLHLIPELGRVPLAKLTAAQVQAGYAHCRAKGLSGTSLQLMHGVLHGALKDGARWNLVVRNVADLVDAPRRTTPEMQTLTPEEAIRLLRAADGDPLEAFYTLAVTCGLRLGELQALRWRDLDLDRRRLKVTATLQGVQDGAPVFAEPKTARSRRMVHLPDMAAAALRTHRTRQLEARLQAGAFWQDFGLVFTTGHGRPLDGNNVRTRSFARLLEKAGLPPMRFHGLRHTAATLLMAEGVNVKVASEMLGHADISTTLRIYSHVLPDMQGDAADAMDRLFGAVQ